MIWSPDKTEDTWVVAVDVAVVQDEGDTVQFLDLKKKKIIIMTYKRDPI